ncbi:MAG: tRNA (N(6)-L-threonylcarbamoyladenosine(37)-C(2))-methylthiotransferase MtaB [bacterium]|nr:tRNA (N(6)-L-threonylcarbamoyladenosine(37)-C(2))-methylthiotransferase MtaB [bacterium]
MKFRIYTFGCKTNQCDSEALRRILINSMEEADDEDAPDIIIVNTCSVTHISERKARTLIRHLMKTYPNARIIVTGCYAERDSKSLEKLGNLIVIGNKEKENIPRLFLSDLKPKILPEDKNKRVRAFVKIQDGCDDFCSYCIVPYVRGSVRSRSINEILDEIKILADLGYPEIVLTGIHIGRFEDKEKRLPDLVKLIYREIPEIKRIRLSSLEPQEVSREAIELFNEIPNLCPHIHLVAQSGSNKVLKDMKRKYTREEYLSLVKAFRSIRDDIEFTTDIIVGFPTEEEDDFIDTLSLIEEVGFVKVHIFPFSPRPGTEAFLLKQIDRRIIKEREERLKESSLNIASDRIKYLIGKDVEILVERYTENVAVGLTPSYLRVYSNTNSPVSVGSFLKVCIEGLEKGKDSIILRGKASI